MILTTVGAEGVGGWEFITAFELELEIHPYEFVTVKVYLPDESPATLKLFPVPL